MRSGRGPSARRLYHLQSPHSRHWSTSASSRQVAARPAALDAAAATTRVYDAIVVGAGVIGCSTAYNLAKRGASVLVVDRRGIAAEQSSKSWGFCRQQGRDLRELPMMVESIAAWTGLEGELGWDVGWQQGGNLALIQTEAERDAKLRWAEAARPYGVETEILDRASVGEILPGLGAECNVQGGMWTESDGSADPEKATGAFAAAAAAYGAQFLLGSNVRELATSEHGRHGRGMTQAGRVEGVVIDSGETITAPIVVLATAAWTDGLLRRSGVGLSIPTLRLHATAGQTEPLGGTSATAPFPAAGVWAKGLSFRLRKDGGLTIADGGQLEEHDIGVESFLHGWRFLPLLRQNYACAHFKLRRDSFPTPRTDACPEPAEARLELARENFSKLFPALPPLRMARSWAGFIDITPDMLPVIDNQAVEGLVLSTGYSGHGLGIAPAAGRLAAELALGIENASVEAAAFRASRLTREGLWVGPDALI
jgi:glycine/D-amino acid oxidase-like deaminating enzyme